MTTKLIDLIQNRQIQEAIDLIKTLTKTEIDLQDQYGDTALIRASNNGYTEIAKLLLDKGANIDLRDKYGINALMRAYGNGHTEIVKLLKN